MPLPGEGKRICTWFHLVDCTVVEDDSSASDSAIECVKGKQLCTLGILKVMHIGQARL